MRARTVLALLLASLGAAGGLAACSESKQEPTGSPKTPATSTSANPTLTSADGGVATQKDAAPQYEGPVIGALFAQTPVMSDMEWPKDQDPAKNKEKGGAVRIGYIRAGAKVPVIPEPHPKSNCKEGWYELVQGGFVCGRYASIDLSHPRFKLAPKLPDLQGPLPYQYAYNIANGTPLYRTVPSRDERLKLEPWLAPKPKKTKPKEDESTASYGDDVDAGTTSPLTLAKATVPTTTDDPFGLGAEGLDAGTPWYLRQYDGGKPQITLDELKGEGPIARRMVKGFFLALDKDMSANGFRWWKTTNGLIAPQDRIFLHNTASKFHGVWLDQLEKEAAAPPPPADGDGGTTSAGAVIVRKPTPDLAKFGSKAQIGIITFYKSHKYIVAVSRKAVTTGDSISRHSVVKLTGDSVTVNGTVYDETDEGWWMKAAEGTKTNPGPVPKDLTPNEKWIDVNIIAQTLVAYEGEKPVFATAVSTGKLNREDREKDHRTPPGTFRIREKHIAATMDGDVATDGPYSIEDVPWIMYFNGSYALHGAFWHNNFGRTQSHGCVNLAPLDAKAMFNWTEPHLPDAWHGVMATTDKPGTRVVVHCGPGVTCEPKPASAQ